MEIHAMLSNVCIGYKYARSVLAVFASTYL